MIKIPKNVNPSPIEKYILENLLKTNVDYKEILELYKNDENAFFILRSSVFYFQIVLVIYNKMKGQI
jgi:hypothetical protein